MKTESCSNNRTHMMEEWNKFCNYYRLVEHSKTYLMPEFKIQNGLFQKTKDYRQ